MKDKRILFICAFGESRSRFFAEKFMKLGYMAMFAGFDDYASIRVQKGMIEWADEIVILDKYWEKVDDVKSWIIEARDGYDKTILEHYIEDEQQIFDKFCDRLIVKMNKSNTPIK